MNPNDMVDEDDLIMQEEEEQQEAEAIGTYIVRTQSISVVYLKNREPVVCSTGANTDVIHIYLR
jgi:hypothetical protein